MPKARIELLRQIVVLVLLVGVVYWLYPQVSRQTDESNFVSTAYKMTRELSLSAASHREEDILAHGRDHKPTKMPGYTIALAVWLKIVPYPDQIRLFNLLLFGLGILLIYRFIKPRCEARWQPWVGVVALASMPMGLAYANTAMSESFVLLIAVLHFLSWYSTSRFRLLWFCLTAFIGFATKETLALMTLSIIAVNLREFRGLHVELWRKSRLGTGAYAGLLVVLGLVGLELLRDRGYFPNFRNSLIDVFKDPHSDFGPSLRTALGMIADRFVDNLERFLSYRRFPHDCMYGYMLLTFGMSQCLTVWSRRRPEFRLHLMLTVFWVLTLLSVLALYRNQQFHAQRVFRVCSFFTLAVWCVSVPALFPKAWLRWALLLVPIAYQSYLAVEVNDFFIVKRHAQLEKSTNKSKAYRAYEELEDPLKPGECVMTTLFAGYRILSENPYCELIVLETEDPMRTVDLLARGQPELVILDQKIGDLTRFGYYRIHQKVFFRSGGRVLAVMVIWRKRE